MLDHDDALPRIHLETSSVLLRQLPVDYLKRPKGWKYAPPSMGESGPVDDRHVGYTNRAPSAKPQCRIRMYNGGPIGYNFIVN